MNKAQQERFSQLSKEQLIEVIDMLQKNWWNLQNNYILHINTEYGEEAAVKADAILLPGQCQSADVSTPKNVQSQEGLEVSHGRHGPVHHMDQQRL